MGVPVEPHESISVRALCIAGAIVLLFALFSSFFSMAATIGNPSQLALNLLTNPNSMGQWVWPIFVVALGILPIVLGLALVAVQFMLRDKTRRARSNRLQLIGGMLLSAWGIYYSLVVYSSYFDALGWLYYWNIGYLGNVTHPAGSLSLIYATYGCIAVLWFITGIFLSVTSAFASRAKPEHN